MPELGSQLLSFHFPRFEWTLLRPSACNAHSHDKRTWHRVDLGTSKADGYCTVTSRSWCVAFGHFVANIMWLTMSRTSSSLLASRRMALSCLGSPGSPRVSILSDSAAGTRETRHRLDREHHNFSCHPKTDRAVTKARLPFFLHPLRWSLWVWSTLRQIRCQRR